MALTKLNKILGGLLCLSLWRKAALCSCCNCSCLNDVENPEAAKHRADAYVSGEERKTAGHTESLTSANRLDSARQEALKAKYESQAQRSAAKSQRRSEKRQARKDRSAHKAQNRMERRTSKSLKAEADLGGLQQRHADREVSRLPPTQQMVQMPTPSIFTPQGVLAPIPEPGNLDGPMSAPAETESVPLQSSGASTAAIVPPSIAPSSMAPLNSPPPASAHTLQHGSSSSNTPSVLPPAVKTASVFTASPSVAPSSYSRGEHRQAKKIERRESRRDYKEAKKERVAERKERKAAIREQLKASGSGRSRRSDRSSTATA